MTYLPKTHTARDKVLIVSLTWSQRDRKHHVMADRACGRAKRITVPADRACRIVQALQNSPRWAAHVYNGGRDCVAIRR